MLRSPEVRRGIRARAVRGVICLGLAGALLAGCTNRGNNLAKNMAQLQARQQALKTLRLKVQSKHGFASDQNQRRALGEELARLDKEIAANEAEIAVVQKAIEEEAKTVLKSRNWHQGPESPSVEIPVPSRPTTAPETTPGGPGTPNCPPGGSP